MEVKEKIRVLKGADGSLETESNGRAELLNSQFKSVFEADTLYPLPEFRKRTEKTFELNQIMCHLNETIIERRLKALKVKKSMGVDYVHPVVLRECAVAFAKHLVVLFRHSCKTKYRISGTLHL